MTAEAVDEASKRLIELLSPVSAQRALEELQRFQDQGEE